MELFIDDTQCYSTMTATQHNDGINECTHTSTQQTSGGIMCTTCGVIVAIRLQIDQTFQQQQTLYSRKKNYNTKSKQNTQTINPFDILPNYFELPVFILTRVRQLYSKISTDENLHALLRVDKTVFTVGIKAKAFVFVLVVKCCRSCLPHHSLENEQKWLLQSKIPRKIASRFFHVYEIWLHSINLNVLK